MKKRVFAVVAALALLVGLLGGAVASDSLAFTYSVEPDRAVTVTLDGEKLELKNALGEAVVPVLVDGTTYLPIRAVSEALGLNVDWEQGDREVILETEEYTETCVTPVFAETTGGWLMGYLEDSTYIFKGIQYGTAERFKTAEPVSWRGVKSALVYAESAPNTNSTVSVSSFVDAMGPDMVQNENCLYLNVWTQSVDNTAGKPVVFFIHGGGYSSGASNELNVYDGKALSEFGDVVYVNVNHRLNYLGYTDLSAYGEEYAGSGNLGQSDLVLALQWVHDNIANFGGDPNNVTIVGQSGGGGKVNALLGTPSAKDLFQKAIQLSGGAGSTGVSLETAQAAGQALVEKCKTTYGLATDAEALEKLETIPYYALAELAAGTGVGAGPVYGTEFWPEQTYNSATGEFCEIAKDKPLIVSSTFAEASGADSLLVIPLAINGAGQYTFDPSDPEAFLANVYKPNMTEEKMVELVTAKYGENADQVLKLFAEAYPDRDPVDVLSIVNRTNTVKYVADKAAQGGAPVYNCVFSYEYPAMGGIMNYHTGGDMTLWFRNVNHVGITTTGDKAGAWAVSDVASTALINFAYSGDPSSDLLDWTPYTADNGATAQFDNNSRVASNPDRELLAYMDSIGAFAGGWPF